MFSFSSESLPFNCGISSSIKELHRQFWTMTGNVLEKVSLVLFRKGSAKSLSTSTELYRHTVSQQALSAKATNHTAPFHLTAPPNPFIVCSCSFVISGHGLVRLWTRHNKTHSLSSWQFQQLETCDVSVLPNAPVAFLMSSSSKPCGPRQRPARPPQRLADKQNYSGDRAMICHLPHTRQKKTRIVLASPRASLFPCAHQDFYLYSPVISCKIRSPYTHKRVLQHGGAPQLLSSTEHRGSLHYQLNFNAIRSPDHRRSSCGIAHTRELPHIDTPTLNKSIAEGLRWEHTHRTARVRPHETPLPRSWPTTCPSLHSQLSPSSLSVAGTTRRSVTFQPCCNMNRSESHSVAPSAGLHELSHLGQSLSGALATIATILQPSRLFKQAATRNNSTPFEPRASSGFSMSTTQCSVRGPVSRVGLGAAATISVLSGCILDSGLPTLTAATREPRDRNNLLSVPSSHSGVSSLLAHTR